MSAVPSDPRAARSADDELDLFDLEDGRADGVDEALLEVSEAASALERELVAQGVDLDEDLFDFGPLPGLDVDPLADAAHEVEEVLAGLDLDSTGLDLGFLDEEEAPAAPAAPVEKPAALETPAAETEAAPAARPALAAASTEEARIPAALPASGSPSFAHRKPLWIAAAVLVLANAALVLLAWRASRDLRSDLDLVRGDLAATARDLRASLAAPAHEVVAAAPAPSEASAPAAQSVPGLPGPGELALRVAREELDQGLHAAARRRIARLLATIDSLPSGERADVEARASFLLAESWTRQASEGEGEAP